MSRASDPTRAEIIRAWAPACAYMTLIFILSSFHLTANVIDELPFKDKLVHALEYALLGALCAHAAQRTWPRRHPLRTMLLGAFLATAFGVSDELHQSFVPGRNADVLDIVADGVGAVVGAIASAAWSWRSRRQRSSGSSSHRDATGQG